MSLSIHLTLPYPPTINHYYGRRRNSGAPYIKKAGRQFRIEVWAICMQMGVPPMTGPLGMEVRVWKPDRRKRDLDNIIKALQDALQAGGAFADDCEIAEKHIYRMGVMKGGKVDVWLEPLELPSRTWTEKYPGVCGGIER